MSEIQWIDLFKRSGGCLPDIVLLGRRLKTQKLSQFHGSHDLASKSRKKLAPPSMSDRCLAGSPKVKLAEMSVLPIDQILRVKLF